MEIVEYFYKGGDIMWLILAALVIEISIIIERGFFYFFNSYPYEKYENYLKKELSEKSISQIEPSWSVSLKANWLVKLKQKMSLFRLKNSVIYKIAKSYLASVGLPQESLLAAVNRESSLLLNQQEKHLRVLSLIGQISPLLGLLGTVTGMIKAFFVIASLGGQVDVTKLAGGISEAMITTAFGLIVALPAYIFYEVYQKVTDDRIERINRMVNLLDEFYHLEKKEDKSFVNKTSGKDFIENTFVLPEKNEKDFVAAEETVTN